ncbi:hypothetical protein Dsin_012645 [Dipteronia sinensis]|uniref:Uncharacterized protein n=1 Tax=Dipteronia sinensis TaxID=43782 RepID=A0AAE0AJ80_9ROSI|nr:hypothetical protein Dsin_012645 [Dipteronia sinensis]
MRKFSRMAKAVSNHVADNHYRPDLKKVALARLWVVHKSLKVAKSGAKKRNRQSEARILHLVEVTRILFRYSPETLGYVSDTLNGVAVDSRMYPDVSSPYHYRILTMKVCFQLWDVRIDDFDYMYMVDVGILKIANLTLDKPELEAELFRSFNNVNDDIEVN